MPHVHTAIKTQSTLLYPSFTPPLGSSPFFPTPPLQSSLKEINNKLIRLLSGSSSRVTLVTLHVLASLSLNSSLGEALFSTSNIEQTFGIIFNIFYHHGDDKTALSHAVDLMAVLLACERIRTAFVGYKHLRACVQSTLTLLVRSRGESAGKLCELFQAFLSVPELHQMIVNTFFGPLCNVDKRRSEGAHGAGQGHENNLVVTCLFSMMGGGQEGGVQWGGAARRCTSRALDLLREVMEVGPLWVGVEWVGCVCVWGVRVCGCVCVWVWLGVGVGVGELCVWVCMCVCEPPMYAPFLTRVLLPVVCCSLCCCSFQPSSQSCSSS